MNTGIDWRGELDSSFGDGSDRPAADFLAPGRAALRRRRTAMGATALATLLVVGGIGWAAAPDHSDTRGGQIASDAADPVTTSVAEARRKLREARQRAAQERAAKPDFLGEPATYDNDGIVVMAPGWTATETIDNPMGYLEQGWTSVGLRAVRGDEEKFVLAALQADPDGSATSVSSSDAVGSLAAWLEGAVSTQRSLDVADAAHADGELTTPDMQPVVMNPNGEWHAFGGVRILDTRARAALPEPLQARGEIVKASQVRAADGSTEWALGWVLDSEADEIISTADFADLDEFVAWAAQQYASGEGLR